jgi:hypothetical protein
MFPLLARIAERARGDNPYCTACKGKRENHGIHPVNQLDGLHSLSYLPITVSKTLVLIAAPLNCKSPIELAQSISSMLRYLL